MQPSFGANSVPGPDLDALRAAGWLSALDHRFARSVARIAGEDRPLVVLAAALASRAVSEGHVCLDLPALVSEGAPWLDPGPEAEPSAATLPPLDSWLDALRSSLLVAGPDEAEPTPLVLDAAGRLYLRRHFEDEVRLATLLRERARDASLVRAGDEAALRASIERLFPRPQHRSDAAGSGAPRVAAAVAADRRLCVVTGGPGTGKTTTAARILAVLVEQALRAGLEVPRLALAAPTGKAAARLGQSIAQVRGALDCEPRVQAALHDDASTLHRLLGARVGGRFRHHAGHPLQVDVLVVDEASMVDLELMTRLLEALPSTARLVLLGDRDQLASVEAGAVLGDLCADAAAEGWPESQAQRLEQLCGERLAVSKRKPAAAELRSSIVELTASHRYAAESGIGALADAVRRGDTAAALAVLEDDGRPDVALVEEAVEEVGEPGLPPQLAADLREGFGDFLDAVARAARTGEAAPSLAALERFRLLCPLRHGRRGVEASSAATEALFVREGRLPPGGGSGAPAHGRPLLVTRNDKSLGLFNGDVGVSIDSAGKRRAIFAAADGAEIAVPPSRLPPHELVFATTVHKSQGSEFDAVALLLPAADSPILTRELLYTAVTRARKRVRIHGSREILRAALERPARRSSGLRDALWGGAPAGP